MSNTGPSNQQFEDLCEALRFKIKAFKRENPNLSGLQIAKIFGMASSTLNRIENRSIRTPSLDQVVKVLRGVGAHGELIEFMDEFYPAISDSFRKHIVVHENVKSDEDVMKLIFEEGNFRIFILAICGRGVSQDYIKTNLGQEGQLRAEKLEVAGIIEKKEGIYTLNPNCKLRFSKAYAKKLHLQLISDQFVPQNTNGIETGIAITSTCSVRDQKVIDEVKKILREAKEKIHQLVDSEESKGDVKYFFTMCCDTIS